MTEAAPRSSGPRPRGAADVDRAEQFTSGPQPRAALAQLGALANQLDELGARTICPVPCATSQPR
jgi:hypothetical protein